MNYFQIVRFLFTSIILHFHEAARGFAWTFAGRPDSHEEVSA
ncbi:hypothetical protein SJ05684_c16890 [Sinorhizobium sojae CCBAU 05684]|uniref:Uncharacterized protein n=1 Tax=Sinorhizobium sojae CCBAU 05684 TaxID=716928 RepID=A0A249PB47_9HYPH|nr:hypothetical protein SJ05684_c16890 [Sinorhizobium sojae CCBAU 05684]